jgi:hypothetical protein
MDISFIPPQEATFTSLWNCVGVGDIAFMGGYIFTTWLAFNIEERSCDVMPFVQVLLFKLNGYVVYRADHI